MKCVLHYLNMKQRNGLSIKIIINAIAVNKFRILQTILLSLGNKYLKIKLLRIIKIVDSILFIKFLL